MKTIPEEIAVAIYDQHIDAEDAVKILQRGGFDMKRISIVARDYETEERVVGFLNAGDRAKMFGKLGAFWGGLMGILFGSALLFVPVVGHVFILGPLAAMLFEGVAGAAVVGGTSALVGAMTAIGIPKDSVLRYERALKANQFLLVVHGVTEDIVKARELLKSTNPTSFDRHDAAEPVAPVTE
ncbi:general stress protein [Povalibacter sp.]|uniref:general stress protein n=1 Tax=Povalibacter sp. TaxID=1962978 RepID=UPI002F41170E